ncbi:hypothetical protein AB0D10_39415 [Kitasatospora sp. NPDC048545]|uniref:hypothetical protein n=1 Tax=Kitasatospora sp. NPDC048545 TaxID=3157208 RepID=UPI0033C15D3B
MAQCLFAARDDGASEADRVVVLAAGLVQPMAEELELLADDADPARHMTADGVVSADG